MPKKQIAVYLRLSLEDTGANDESNSITAQRSIIAQFIHCLLYTSDAADD